MSNGLFENQTLPLKCPGCGRTTQQRVGLLKTSPRITCAGCRETIEVKADDFRRQLDQIQQQVERMGFKVR